MKPIDCAIQIRERLPVKDALERYGISFNARGFASCPFHNEKTPSFKVQNNYKWHCFGCGKSGDIIDYVIEVYGLKWQEAISKINADFALSLPIDRPVTVSESLQASRRQHELERERARKAAEVEKYEQLLDTFAAFDTAIMRLKPKPGETEISGVYMYALMQIEYYKWLLSVTPLPERG